MKISTIQIKDYRSILDAELTLGNMTILLGKNNEGKSNLLMAINVAVSTLQFYAEIKKKRMRYDRMRNSEHYFWDNDYPTSKRKGDKRNKKTTFILEFNLDEREIEDFKKNIGHQLNGTLPIKITFESDNSYDIKVVKQGKGSRPLNEKSQKVARYIAEHIEFNYIPAVRTIEHTMEIINEQITERLQEERKDKEYQEALKIINDKENKTFSSLSDEIKNTLIEFLPNINTVSLTSEDLGMMIRRRQEYVFMIDDGENTNLKNKGDGVKSLVAMSLLKNKKYIPNTASVIAIEEPESHLHPSAIDALRKSILALSEQSQVIITTHNPQFVNRNAIESNIIVENGTAVKASNIRQIREVLGVKLSDNLYGAKLLLYVEGITDRIVLNALLKYKSTKLAEAIKNNELVIQPMSGADHIEMHLTTAKAMLADFFVFLDNDQAGKNAINSATKKSILQHTEYMLTTYDDMTKESEMEDMIDVDLYRNEINKMFSIDLTIGKFKARNKKWADRIKDIFNNEGKLINDDVLNEIKLKVAQLVAANAEKALRSEGEVFISKLIVELEKKLN